MDLCLNIIPGGFISVWLKTFPTQHLYFSVVTADDAAYGYVGDKAYIYIEEGSTLEDLFRGCKLHGQYGPFLDACLEQAGDYTPVIEKVIARWQARQEYVAHRTAAGLSI